MIFKVEIALSSILKMLDKLEDICWIMLDNVDVCVK